MKQEPETQNLASHAEEFGLYLVDVEEATEAPEAGNPMIRSACRAS